MKKFLKTVIVKYPVPSQFIGMWCMATEANITSKKPYWVVDYNRYVFDSKEQAEKFCQWQGYDLNYLKIMQITADSPVWQTDIAVCITSPEQLDKQIKILEKRLKTK